MSMKNTIAGIAAGLALVGGVAALAPSASAAFTAPAVTSAPQAPLTADGTLAATLAFSHEEERMARDLYQKFSDTYDGLRPFSMITRSEQQHMESIGRLLTAYGLPDPSAGKAAGVYSDPELQKLYDAWLAQGLTSVDEAEKVGVALEQRDIADLETLIAKTTQQDVKDVLSRLLAGSRNHLKAFEAAVANTTPAGPMGQARQGTAPGQANGMGPRDGNGNGTAPGRFGQGGMVDANGDGICDVTGQPMPADGTGLRQGPGAMVDANGDGICDVTGQPMPADGTGLRQGPRGNR